MKEGGHVKEGEGMKEGERVEEGEGVKEGGCEEGEGVKECEVVRSLHVPGRHLFLPVSVKRRVNESCPEGAGGGWGLLKTCH